MSKSRRFKGRRVGDRATLPHRHDLRAEPRRHQPQPARILRTSRYYERRERLATHIAKTGRDEFELITTEYVLYVPIFQQPSKNYHFLLFTALL